MTFFREKLEVIEKLKSLFIRIKMKISHPIVRIRSDKGRQFENVDVYHFCKSKGIKHEFSAFRTPQQDGVVERNNIVL